MQETDIRARIVELVGEHLALEAAALDKYRRGTRLDEVTAADSMLLVELVMMLEERFDIRFEPEHIDTDLLCDLDRLAAFVAGAHTGG